MKGDIENILFDLCKAEPFHNLFYLLGEHNYSTRRLGGTCSDKALRARDVLKNQHIVCRIHTGQLEGGHEHRLLAVVINHEWFYADVGSGWPSYKLFSGSQPSEYRACGIFFHSDVKGDKVDIWHTVENKNGWVLTVPKLMRNERFELNNIKKRYDTKLPFEQGVRFSQLVDDRFIFLKDKTVRIYRDYRPVEIASLKNAGEIVDYIEDVFKFQLNVDRSRILGLMRKFYG